VRTELLFVVSLIAAPVALGQQAPSSPVALTIYNQDFAVARTAIDLDLHPGKNEVTSSEVTSRLEPDSVVLRDPSGQHAIHIAEQNYDAAVVTQEWLLQKYEGKTIDFQVLMGNSSQVIQGRIVRAGYQRPFEYDAYGQQAGGGAVQPLIEVNGKLQFQLPGIPLFPATADLQLKPTLRWQIIADKKEHFAAELAYLTGGLDWEATYNIVAPDSSDVTRGEKADVLGWVTIHNQSGVSFPEARIKLMAGDVAKLTPANRRFFSGQAVMAMAQAVQVEPQVTQKPFDDFHLYDLNRTVALDDGETKQVQFLDAEGVTIRRGYLYDGSAADLQYNYGGGINEFRDFGLDTSRTKVNIIEETRNSQQNHLGMPLPAGRVRLYRRDSDGQMEFVGESIIGHTPAEETVKLLSGSAFDIKGSRTQTDFSIDHNRRELTESFAVKITNEKDQPIDVTVVEHMYRGASWEIVSRTIDFTKRDSSTVEFPLHVPAKGELSMAYSVRYSW
jgi:hypothetical protein